MKKCFLILLIAMHILPVNAIITDDFVETTLSKNLVIRPHSVSFIKDDFAESNLNKSAPKLKVEISECIPTVKDESIKRKVHVISERNENYVLISINKSISTKSRPQEGSIIEFRTVTSIKYHNNIYPEGTVVKARVETVSMNNTWGTPADLVIGNFSIDNKPLFGEIYKTGSNRTLWVKPVSCIATPVFGAGMLMMLIRGGHASIKPDEIFTVYY